MNRTLDLLIVSVRSTHLDRPHQGHLDCTDVGHALQEVEAGQQQVLLGVGSHAQQVVLAKVAVYECQEIALGVVDAYCVIICTKKSGGTPSENFNVAVRRRKQVSWTSSEIVGKACPQCFMAWKATSRTRIGSSSSCMSTP